ncbi:mediator complex subunit, partial [Kickxella alabastrina]
MLDRQQSVDSPGTGLDRTDSQRTMVGSNGSQYRNRQQSQQDLPSGLNSSQSFGSGGDGGPYRGNHAFEGRPHGYSAQNGSGGGGRGEDGNGSGAVVDSDADTSSEVEDIPTINARMVPMSVVVGRLITFAYTELVTLVDTMPSRAEGDRLNEILKYTEHMTDLLTKLLVLVRWAKNAPQIQKCQNVIAYLDLQNRYFDYSVDSIYATYLAMPNVRMRNYDVSNAVDILTTGTYQRLPAAIKRAVPPPKLTKQQISDTLSAIDNIIRGRILRGEPIPLAMRQYRIANGRIVFTVHKEFEATLTLLQFDHNIPWHVVNVRVLVTGDKSLPDEHQIVVNARKIVDLAQHLLIESNPVPVDTSPEQQQKHTASLSARPPQLAQLYDFLHRQCLVVLLETIVKQAAVLRRTRWENLLQVEMGPDRSVLTLRYWTSPRAASSLYPSTAASGDGGSTIGAVGTLQEKGSIAQAGAVLRGNSIVFRLCLLPIPRPIHASALDGPDALEASPADSDGDIKRSEFLRIEHDRRNLIPKIGLSVTWSANSGLGTPRVWTRTVSQASELVTSPPAEDNGLLMEDFDMVLDPESVNTEKLLRQVTWRHARTILKALHASVVESGLFGDNAVELMYVLASGAAKGESELTREEISLGTVTPRLRAWYRQEEGAVDIFVDTYTGRLVVRASEAIAASTSLSEAMVSQLADQLNRGPWRLAELLVDMRSSLALVDLDSLAFRSLGLRPQSTQGSKAPALPGFVLSGIYKRMELAAAPHTHTHHPIAPGGSVAGSRPNPGAQGVVPHAGGMSHHAGVVSPGMQSVASGSASGVAGLGFYQPSVMASNFPLRISQQEADALVRDVAGVDNPLSRIRFYKIEGTEGVEEQLDSIVPNSAAIGAGKGEWYIMVAMTDRLRFRLVLLNPHPIDQLMFVIGQIISLQVDRLFSSVARRLMAEKQLDSTIFSHPKAGAPGTKRSYGTSSQGDLDLESKAEAAKGESSSERKITEKVDAMLTGRTSIKLDYLNALASTCRARLALRLLQTQLTRWKIPYSFRLPSFSTSPHGHRAAVSKELSVVGLDRMGLYELDEQVPTLYIPVVALMRASPINWGVASLGVLPDESRRMVSIRIASDELDPSMRADLSPSTRVDQHRQAALAKSAGK